MSRKGQTADDHLNQADSGWLLTGIQVDCSPQVVLSRAIRWEPTQGNGWQRTQVHPLPAVRSRIARFSFNPFGYCRLCQLIHERKRQDGMFRSRNLAYLVK